MRKKQRKPAVREWLAVIAVGAALAVWFVSAIHDWQRPGPGLAAVSDALPPQPAKVLPLSTSGIMEFAQSAQSNGFVTKDGNFDFGRVWKFIVAAGDVDGDCQLTEQEMRKVLADNMGMEKDVIDKLISKLGLKKGWFDKAAPKLTERKYKDFLRGVPNMVELIFLSRDDREAIRLIIESGQKYFNAPDQICLAALMVSAYEKYSKWGGEVDYSSGYVENGGVVVTRLATRNRKEAEVYRGDLSQQGGLLLLTDLTEGTYRVDYQSPEGYKPKSMQSKSVALSGHKLGAVNFEVEKKASVRVSVRRIDRYNLSPGQEDEVEGAQVTITYMDGKRRQKTKIGLSDKDGTFILTEDEVGPAGLLIPQKVSVSAAKKGLVTPVNPVVSPIGSGETFVPMFLIKPDDNYKPSTTPRPVVTTKPEPVSDWRDKVLSIYVYGEKKPLADAVVLVVGGEEKTRIDQITNSAGNAGVIINKGAYDVFVSKDGWETQQQVYFALPNEGGATITFELKRMVPSQTPVAR